MGKGSSVSVNRIPPIHNQSRSLHESSLAAAEEEHAIGHLLRRSASVHGRDGDEGTVVFDVRVDHGGVYYAWAYAVHCLGLRGSVSFG